MSGIPLSKAAPELVVAWDQVRNGVLTPDNVSYGSKKKVWWKCPTCGGSWEATPNNVYTVSRRPNSSLGCPYCAGKMVSPEYNLGVKHPELLQQWDSEKNGTLTPFDVLPGSNKKVWWKCPDCGESWEAAPNTVYSNSRKTSGALGCPYCAGKRVSSRNNLATSFPEVAPEWDSEKNGALTPFDVLPGSNMQVWWRCPSGHSYRSSPHSRTGQGGRGCPICAGKKIIHETSLVAHYPEVAKQWHPTKNGGLTPADVSPGSNKQVWWKCREGHEWRTTVHVRTIQGSGCPVCAGVSTSLFEMRLYCELGTLFPDIKWRMKPHGFELDLYIPSLEVGIEADGSYWHKEKAEREREKNALAAQAGVKLIRLREEPLKQVETWDIEYGRKEDLLFVVYRLLDALGGFANSPQLRRRIEQYKALGAFVDEAGYRKLAANLPAPPFENSLASVHPDLAAEWSHEKNAPLSPEMFMPRSDRKVWWQCGAKGHEYFSRIADRTAGCGCPYCNGKKTAPEDSLASVSPEIAESWDATRNGGLTPRDVRPKSSKRVWWRCDKCGESWLAPISSRAAGHGCPYCAGNKASRLTSLASQHPEIANTWDKVLNGSLTPHDVTPGSSNKKVWWQCPYCGERWQATVKSRLQSGTNVGCRKCNALIKAGSNLEKTEQDGAT